MVSTDSSLNSSIDEDVQSKDNDQDANDLAQSSTQQQSNCLVPNPAIISRKSLKENYLWIIKC